MLFSSGSLIISYLEISQFNCLAFFSIIDLSPIKTGMIKFASTACFADSIETGFTAFTITAFDGPFAVVCAGTA